MADDQSDPESAEAALRKLLQQPVKTYDVTATIKRSGLEPLRLPVITIGGHGDFEDAKLIELGRIAAIPRLREYFRLTEAEISSATFEVQLQNVSGSFRP